jgi:hypothetical protein
MREAVVEDADKTEGKDCDLMHGDGGTPGLDEGEESEQRRLGFWT